MGGSRLILNMREAYFKYRMKKVDPKAGVLGLAYGLRAGEPQPGMGQRLPPLSTMDNTATIYITTPAEEDALAHQLHPAMADHSRQPSFDGSFMEFADDEETYNDHEPATSDLEMGMEMMRTAPANQPTLDHRSPYPRPQTASSSTSRIEIALNTEVTIKIDGATPNDELGGPSFARGFPDPMDSPAPSMTSFSSKQSKKKKKGKDGRLGRGQQPHRPRTAPS